MSVIANWLTENYIEVFGAITGIIYVFLEIRQNIWLWPVGIVTSAVYIWVFFTGKLYADMGLQGYYLVISVLGWYWWVKGGRRKAEGERGEGEKGRVGEGDVQNELPSLESLPRDSGGAGVGFDESTTLEVSRIKLKTSIILTFVFLFLYVSMWKTLDHFTDSPVPGWDSFITSLSIIATWMLAMKLYEHWYLWIVVNAVAVLLFLSRGLYPTVVLYGVYLAMSFIGLKEWNIPKEHKGRS
jgi:nicotinamide mononucleotide transporter